MQQAGRRKTKSTLCRLFVRRLPRWGLHVGLSLALCGLFVVGPTGVQSSTLESPASPSLNSEGPFHLTRENRVESTFSPTPFTPLLESSPLSQFDEAVHTGPSDSATSVGDVGLIPLGALGGPAYQFDITRAAPKTIVTQTGTLAGVPTNSLVRQDIRYQITGAGEVLLVWWVNDWQLPPVSMRPPGSFEKNGIIHTPMTREGHDFVAAIARPQGTVITHAFLITKTRNGADVNVWDANGYPPRYYVARTDRPSVVLATVNLTKAESLNNQTRPSIRAQEIRYERDDAGEVWLVWGINGWQGVPEAMRPSGTVLKNHVMHTPMTPREAGFTVTIQVPSDSTIDYGFLMTKTRTGAGANLWESNGDQPFHLYVTENDVRPVTIRSKVSSPVPTPDPATSMDAAPSPALVSQAFRYQAPGAGEVFFVWGINGWDQIAAQLRPSGTVLKDGLMHTPMTREGDTFVAQVRVPARTAIAYGFAVTKTRNGTDVANVHVWQDDGGRPYRTVATEDNTTSIPSTVLLAQPDPSGQSSYQWSYVLIVAGLAIGVYTMTAVAYRPKRFLAAMRSLRP
ncbi:MAG TPA: carbohydrate-binding protein, partial [Nitrospiraceae bacterium]|nr:carbohydrate-binding protein [Nitrospiraceae bacterium]